MSSKRFAERENERKRKNGVRRWKSEVDRFGSEVIPLIPKGLKEEVVGGVESEGILPELPDNFMRKLRKVAPKRQGQNPYHVLEGIIKRRGG